jgi:predicted secreted protein
MNKSAGLRLATFVAILVVMTDCGGVSGPSTASCQGASQSGTIPVITEVDSGRCFKLAVDRTGELRLTDKYQWSEPQVSGDTVTLVRVNALVDPGYSAWEIRARRSGTATISASGVCAAANCTKPTVAFSVTIVVSS